MAYGWELGNGQHLFLDQSGTQTLVTLSSSSPGQQQQATQGIQTGSWTIDPEVFCTADSWVVKLQTTQGEYFVRIQGSGIGVLSNAPDLSNAQAIDRQRIDRPSPMPPMQPMQMGNMSMSLKPMEMKMGNMSMRLDNPIVPSAPSNIRQFCSQCGVAVQSSDRFCASCGHQLGS